ncbi:Mor transcription activator family protein [Thiofaba sp. EF100]|uniref:Mor transcription activator family protein n=1 Tax=Thiofaba sp. EF100 TaxID=3121274 RepID=UPI003221E839
MMDNRFFDLIESHDLPATARQIVALIGLPDTILLVEKLGGTTFPMPVGKNAMGELRFTMLAEKVGVDIAKKLCEHYAREKLYIPRCAEALLRARNRIIHQQFDEMIKRGMSANHAIAMMAPMHKLSDRHIWNILKIHPDSYRERDAAQQTLPLY